VIRRAAPAAVALFFAAAACADALPKVRLSADRIDFFSSPLALVAHGHVRLDGGAVGRGTADAAYVDLRTDHVVLAGDARFGASSGDAIALDLDTARVSVLQIDAAGSGGDFDFPDIDPHAVFIRSLHATLVPHATVRFAPATFPSSAGTFPVPSFMYPFNPAGGFSAQSLPGATFDQPYALVGSTTELTSAHLRYETGVGPTLAFDNHLVDGDRAYLVSSIDAPGRAAQNIALTGYDRMGDRYTVSIDGATARYGSYLHGATTAAFGKAGARIDYSMFSGGGSTGNLNLRGPDLPLIDGATYRISLNAGMNAQPGGVYPELPDPSKFSTVWYHGFDVFVATPQFHGPFRTSIGATADAARTWYDFPHRHDSLTTSATISRPFGKTLTLFGTYTETNDLENYFLLQGLFYPPPAAPFIAPDGTPWPGFATFTGASLGRLAQLDVQLVTSPTTTYRLTLAHTNDFPQFHGFGRPQNEVNLDVRFRLAPNIGIDVGRGYAFDWAGTRWVPQWQFSVLP
jgi:hypothetical protein